MSDADELGKPSSICGLALVARVFVPFVLCFGMRTRARTWGYARACASPVRACACAGARHEKGAVARDAKHADVWHLVTYDRIDSAELARLSVSR